MLVWLVLVCLAFSVRLVDPAGLGAVGLLVEAGVSLLTCLLGGL